MCDVTILMPCLNEAETLESCILEAIEASTVAKLDFEVLIADNGSSDGSQAIAERAAARVVSVSQRGYGAALIAGITAARGDFVVFGDCDCSYDFGDTPKFVKELKSGKDLVMGNRFTGGIQKGAMPWLHRYLGNPVLSGIGRLFFKAPVGDFHCGLRGLRKSAFAQIPFVTSGMEFASELVVKAAVNGLRISEVPTALRPDGRSRRPHLQTWRDGWRHLRFMLLFSPEWLFFAPAVGLLILSMLIGLRLMLGPIVMAGVKFDIHTMLLMGTGVVGAIQLFLFAMFSRSFSTDLGVLPPSDRLEKTRRWLSLERGLILGGSISMAGTIGVLKLFYDWRTLQFGNLNPELTLRSLIPSATLMIAGLQIGFGSFFLGLLSLTPVRNETAKSQRK